MLLKDFLSQCIELLTEKKISNAKYDAESIVAKHLEVKRSTIVLYYKQYLPNELIEKITYDINLRAQNFPLQYIIGDVDFYNVTLKVTPDVLIPRHETEELVEFLCKKISQEYDLNSLNILDLGTGSGAISLSLAKNFPKSNVFAVEFSEKALEIATKNAELNNIKNVQFIHSDWFTNVPINLKFDVIVSNPPYLTENEWESAQPEVKIYEPKSALTANNDGLEDIEKIINDSQKFLHKHSLLAIETGVNHCDILQTKYEKLFQKVSILKDLYGRNRFFIGEKF